jgi:hypothetical protein
VRGSLAVGLSTPNTGATASTFNASRAFIQWAGFTFGQATSFFEFHNGFFVSYGSTPFQSDTGDQGHGVAAYTAQLGGGLSATLSAEVRRITQIVGQGATATTLSVGTITGGGILSAYGGWQVPDIVDAPDVLWLDSFLEQLLPIVRHPFEDPPDGFLQLLAL